MFLILLKKKIWGLKVNKRANEQVMSLYWFAVLFIVAGAIAFMVVSFYGEPFDVRNVEANLLSNHIADCIASGGEMNFELNEINSENVLELCEINLNVEEIYNWEDDQIYFKISFIDYENSNIISEVEQGNSNFVEFCNKGNKNPVCVEKTFFALDNGEEVLVKVFTGIRKTEKNE